MLTHGFGHSVPVLQGQLRVNVCAFLHEVSSLTGRGAPSDSSLAAAALEKIEENPASSSRLSDAFVWRKMVERQRRWFLQGAGFEPARDEYNRFLPSPFNPLPQLNPQDKLQERRYIANLATALNFPVKQPRLIATIGSPDELSTHELPSSWALKPVGASYSKGVVLVRDGFQRGQPFNRRRTVAWLKKVVAGEDLDSEKRLQVTAQGLKESQALRWNASAFLIEELVNDESGSLPPIDYRCTAHRLPPAARCPLLPPPPPLPHPYPPTHALFHP